ncbi:MAG: F0F1 ATP synthase subunit A [Firmicutes bacterium]|nr:F0F1 ATP synthase subunit A [Bacillota bacterium]
MPERPFFSLSPQVVSSLIIITVLSILFIILGKKISKLKPTETPKGFLFAIVYLTEMIINMMKPYLPGKRFGIYAPYLFSILIYLAFANTVALFGLMAPLSNIGVAMSFTLITFFMLKFTEIKFIGVKQKLKNIFVGHVWQLFPIMVPINLIGEISTPLTMGIRLFGNLVSGTVISVFLYAVTGAFFGIFAGVFLHSVFDVFFGLIQAFVFFMLSLVNLSMASDAS